MMKWLTPPIIKIYEALGAVADGRTHTDGMGAKVYSSSGNKFYEVSYDPSARAIMTNDNGSYWKGYLGYPSIAFLLLEGTLEYRTDLGMLLKGIPWKDINQKFKNDFDKTLEFILAPMGAPQRQELESYANDLLSTIVKLDLSLLGQKTLPPEGY